MRTPDGRQYGPVSRLELDAWFGEGRIDADCQILCEGWNQWKWASDVYPQLESTVPEIVPIDGATNPITDFSIASPDGPAMRRGPESLPGSSDSLATPRSWPTENSGSSIALRPADRTWTTVDIGLAVSNGSLWVVLASLLCLVIAWAGIAQSASLPPIGLPTSEAAASPLPLLGAWGMVSLGASSVSLLTGWFICMKVPKRSSAYSMILASVACIGAAMVVALLLTAIPLGVSEVFVPADRLATLAAAGIALVCLLSVAAVSFFGLFLGRLGSLLGDWGLNQQGTFFAASQIATVVWFGVAGLLLDGETTRVKLVRIVVSALLLLGNCYWLGCLVRRARRSLKSAQPAFESPGADGVQ
jgi:hypothetical protein